MPRAPAPKPTAVALRALGLGDFVTGLPALALLRRALPGHRLLLAAPPVFAPLLSLGVPVDGLVPTGELQPVPVPPPVELAIDLHGNGPASRRLLTSLQPARVVGFGHCEAGLPGPPWRAEEHEIARWQRLVGEAFGLDPAVVTGQPARLALPPESPPLTAVAPGATVVHPGAAYPARRWPVKRFAELTRLLVRAGHRVVATGAADEAGLLGELAAAGARPMPGLSVRQLFGLVGRARLVVSGDTGAAHVASLYRTPSVVLFGPVAPSRWGPPAGGPHRVLWHGDGTGNPHGDRPDPALLRIAVPEVFAAISELDHPAGQVPA